MACSGNRGDCRGGGGGAGRGGGGWGYRELGRGSHDDPDEPFIPPKTPIMLLKDDARDDELSPDTEENVVEQTDGVFRNFVYHMQTLGRRGWRSRGEAGAWTGVGEEEERPDIRGDEALAVLPELTAFADQPMSSAARIGRQLALLGDEIDRRYEPEFNQMIRMMNLTPETAYEAFAGVARKLFRDGNVNWGRIVTLLCFGYRMAVTVIQQGIRGFFSQIVGFVVRFVLTERIAKWVADQGGWRAALRYVPETVGWSTLGIIFAAAAISVSTAVFLSRRS